MLDRVLLVLADIDPDVNAAKEAINNLFIKTIIPVILWAVSLVGIIVTISIGIKFMNANSPEEQAAVKKKLISWIIGTAIIFMSSSLYTIISNFFIKASEDIEPSTATTIIPYLRTWFNCIRFR